MLSVLVGVFIFFFFKQKTAYEMRISALSSDVCSPDLDRPCGPPGVVRTAVPAGAINAAVRRARQSRAVLRGQPPQHRLHGGRGDRARARLRRSEERRVGKEWVRTCRSRWSRDHEKKKLKANTTKKVKQL